MSINFKTNFSWRGDHSKNWNTNTDYHEQEGPPPPGTAYDGKRCVIILRYYERYKTCKNTHTLTLIGVCEVPAENSKTWGVIITQVKSCFIWIHHSHVSRYVLAIEVYIIHQFVLTVCGYRKENNVKNIKILSIYCII